MEWCKIEVIMMLEWQSCRVLQGTGVGEGEVELGLTRSNLRMVYLFVNMEWAGVVGLG